MVNVGKYTSPIECLPLDPKKKKVLNPQYLGYKL